MAPHRVLVEGYTAEAAALLVRVNATAVAVQRQTASRSRVYIFYIMQQPAAATTAASVIQYPTKTHKSTASKQEKLKLKKKVKKGVARVQLI